MAVLSRVQTKTIRSTPVRQNQLLQMSLFTFVAATVGTVVGFVAAVAVALPIIHQDLASQTALLGSRLASSLANDNVSTASGCVQPTGSGAVLGEATVNGNNSGGVPKHHHGGMGGDTFIKKLVGGQFVTTNATIENTGPDSENKIITENTSITHIENTNTIDITNTNDQSATSGSASVKQNTTGGDAASGDTSNQNDTSLHVTVSN